MRHRLQKTAYTFTKTPNNKIESNDRIVTLFVTKLLPIVTQIFLNIAKQIVEMNDTSN